MFILRGEQIELCQHIGVRKCYMTSSFLIERRPKIFELHIPCIARRLDLVHHLRNVHVIRASAVQEIKHFLNVHDVFPHTVALELIVIPFPLRKCVQRNNHLAVHCKCIVGAPAVEVVAVLRVLVPVILPRPVVEQLHDGLFD